MKETISMKDKLKAEGKVILESKVGEKKVVVGNKVLKVTKIILVYMQSIDSRGKAEVRIEVNKVNALYQERASTHNIIQWHITVEMEKVSQDN